jgi:DNA-binding response OmpR family regulator
MKILVTEKNEIIRNLILHILTKEDYDLKLASNGKEAFTFLSEEKFDIIITNIHLQYYSGFELITYIKSKDHLKDTKIVILSDNFTPENILRLYKMGIDDMIEKPFTPMEMICRLGKLSELITKEKNLGKFTS